MIGERVEIDFRFPDATTKNMSSGPVKVEDPDLSGPEWDFSTRFTFTVDVDDGRILVQFGSIGFGPTNGGFNGFSVVDFDGAIDPFASLVAGAITGTPLPGTPVLSFTDDELLINFNTMNAGNVTNTPELRTYEFLFTTQLPPVGIPEPSTYASLGSLFALIGIRKSQKRLIER